MSKEIQFTWSEEEYTLRDFVDRFANKLPVVVNVTEGWAGIDVLMHTFGSGEEYQINGIKRQRRVLAIESKQKGRCFGIPLDFPTPFRGKLNDRKIEGDLNAIVDKYMKNGHAPDGLRIYVDDDHDKQLSFMIGSDQTGTLTVTEMVLDHVYEEKYLLVNSVMGGVVYPNICDIDERFRSSVKNCDKGCTAMPTYMPIKLALSNGLVEGTDEDYENVLYNMCFMSKNWNHQKAKINKEILLFDEYLSDGNYEYIEPNTWMSVSSATSQKCNQDLYSYASSQKARECSDLYEEVDLSGGGPATGGADFPTGQGILGMSAAAKANKMKRNQGPNLFAPKLPDRCPVTKTGEPKSLPLPAKCPSTKEEALSLPTPARRPSTKEETASLPPPERQPSTKEEAASLPLPSLPPAVLKKPPAVLKKPPAVLKKPHQYVNNIPRASVNPQSQPAPKVNPAPAPSRDVKTTPVREEEVYGDLSQVPRNIAALSCNQIAECLKKLKLGRYAAPFLENDIDGQLLKSLTCKDEMAEMMRESFGMNQLEAQKLWLFTHEGYKR